MPVRQGWLHVALVGMLAAGSPPTQAEVGAAGPVKIITQIAAGNGADVALRIVAAHLSARWGEQVVIVNQPGAGGLIAARAAAGAPADGHTLLMAVTSTLVMLPEMQANLPFGVDDFVPIGFVGEVPMVIAASPTLPVNSLAELIALSKQKVGGLSVAMPPRGDLPHLTAALLRTRTGAALTAVHYQTMAQAMNDVISGRVPVAIEGAGRSFGTGTAQIACDCLAFTHRIAT